VIRDAFRALAHRNYRLFMVGQGVSLVGTWMQQTGLWWLVYERTGQASMLGLVAFCGQVPAFFLAPIAGVLVDRLDRRRVLFFTQTAAAVQAWLLVVLYWNGQLATWQIIALSTMLGVVNAIDMPARQAFLSEMAPSRSDLPSAIALNSSMVNLSRLIGPPLGGILYDAGGALACFLTNAVSFVAVLAALAAMRDLPKRPSAPAMPLHKGLAEGLRYAFGFPPIRALLLMVAMVSLWGMSVMTLLPVFAKDVLHGDPRLFGFLSGASGVGALGAALYIASRRTVVGLGAHIAWAGVVFGAGMIAFSFSRVQLLSLGILVVTGSSMMLLLAGCNSLLQTLVDDDKRGRVMSLYTMAFMGTAPWGSLLAGMIADGLGAPAAAQIGGAVCIAGALAFSYRLADLRRQVMPIYERVGLVPPTTAAVQAASELRTPPEGPT
jgi:MFS family permease